MNIPRTTSVTTHTFAHTLKTRLSISPELRKRLGLVTREEQDVKNHVAAVGAIPSHSVLLVQDDDARAPKAKKYNCFAYALNLADSKKYSLISSTFVTLHANSTFVEFLLENKGLIEIQAEEAGDGDVIIYFDEIEPTHAGKLFGHRVVSKWGIGLLWEHAIEEVPAQYGDDVRFFREVSAYNSEALFLRYVQGHGVALEKIPGWQAIAVDPE